MPAPGPGSQLGAGVHTPIAQLSPELLDIKSRIIRGTVTITWPYSAFRDVTAFVLAEPDFRLRREKGQVRIEFSGPSAKAVADAQLNSGDELVLGLDGVQWAERDPRAPITGTPLDFQLKFHNKLLLHAVGVLEIPCTPSHVC